MAAKIAMTAAAVVYENKEISLAANLIERIQRQYAVNYYRTMTVKAAGVTRGTPAAIAARNATKTTPIVMAAIGAPLARPGGNVTGLSAFVTELTAKRIEIMRELMPQMSRMALLDNMENRSVPPQWDEMKKATLALGIQPQLCDVHRPEDIEPAFNAAMAEHADALSVEMVASLLRAVAGLRNSQPADVASPDK